MIVIFPSNKDVISSLNLIKAKLASNSFNNNNNNHGDEDENYDDNEYNDISVRHKVEINSPALSCSECYQTYTRIVSLSI